MSNLEALNSTTISFTEEEILASAKTSRKRFKEGWYPFRVTKAEHHVTTNAKSKGLGNFGLKLTLAAVDENGDTTQPNRINHYVIFPKATPPDILEGAGLDPDMKKEAPDTWGMVQTYFRATDPEGTPVFPKKDADNPDLFFFAEEERVVTYEERNEIVNQLKVRLGTRLAEVWADPSTLEGDELIGKLRYNQRGYAGLATVRAELPDDEEFVDLSDPIEE